MKHLLFIALAVASFDAFAVIYGCSEEGHSVQTVIVMRGIEGHAAWNPEPDGMQSLTLKNGFKVGVEIAPVPDEFYLEHWPDSDVFDEMVRITLYDLSADDPAELTTTYGGSNSVQGYTSRGGADRVDELGEEGVTFLLSKPHCITREQLTSN